MPTPGRMGALTGIIQGIYEVRRELGRGNMGVVYLAHDLTLDRDVALKTLHDELARDPQAVAAFRAEALAAAKLISPHIVATYAVLDHDGQPVMVLELLRGEPLSRALEAGQTFAAADLVRVGGDVAEALEVAHAHGVVHRDIKPDNIVAEPGGAAKVMDFGIASVAASSGAGLGTAAYMAPEQVLGTADHRADLYALGGTLYEMATGRLPFEGETPEIILYRKQHEPPVPPSRFGVALPAAVERLILQLLDPDPAQRPQSAAEVRAVLDEAARTASTRRSTRAGATDALIGRDAERLRLAEACARAALGTTAVFVVRTDPGCGRSRFLRAVAEDAQAAGLRVLDLVPTVPGREVAGAALRAALGDTTLRAWCEGGPACILIDDAEDLDATSADAVLRACRDATQGLVCVIAAPAGSGHTWHARLDAEVLMLAPLDPEAFADLVRAHLHQPLFTEDFLRGVYDRTHGVPADVFDLLAAYRAAGVLAQEKGRWVVDGDPDTVATPAAMIARARRRLASCDAAQRALLACAAVQGAACDPDVLAHATGATLLATLQSLHALGDVVEWDADGRARFAHPAVREVVYGELAEPLKRAYHRAIAEAIAACRGEDDGAAASALADHAFRAGDFARALPYLLRAGERAAGLFDHDAAEGFYRRALDCYAQSETDTTAEQCTLRETLGGLCAELGRHADAFDHYDIAHSLAQAYGDRPRAARLAKLMGDVADARQDTELALRLYAEAQAVYEALGDTQGLADVYRATGNVYFERSDMPRVLEFYGKTLEIAEATSDKNLIARACNNLGAAYNVRGERATAIAFYQRSIDSYRAIEDARGEAQTTNNIGMTYAALHNWAEAVNFHRRAVNLASDIQFLELQAIARLGLAEAEARLGQLESAEENVDQALATFRERQDRLGAADSYRVKAVIAGLAGRAVEAEQYFEESMAVCDEIGGKLQEAECRRDYAVFLADHDRADEARLHLELALLTFTELQASEHAADVQRLIDGLDAAAARAEEQAA